MMDPRRGPISRPSGAIGQTVTIPVSLRVESYSASNSVSAAPREDELRELRVALNGVREELRQVKLTVAELVRVSYDSAARLDNLVAPARLGAHIMEAMQGGGDGGNVTQEVPMTHATVSTGRSVAMMTPMKSPGASNASKIKRQPQSTLGKGRPPGQIMKKKPDNRMELLRDLTAQQDGDPVVVLVKKAVGTGQALTRQERESWPKESQLLMRQWSRLELHGGILYRRACLTSGSPPVRQLVASSGCISKHLHAAHRRMGHCGADKLLDWIRGHVFSPQLGAQVEQVVRQCEKCGSAQRVCRVIGAVSLPLPPVSGDCGEDPATETGTGSPGLQAEPGEDRCESPGVYIPEPDPDLESIPLLPQSDSGGSDPEGVKPHVPGSAEEPRPAEEVLASSSPDVTQQPLCQKEPASFPAAADAEPLADDCAKQPCLESSGTRVDLSLAKTDCGNQPASHHDGSSCGITVEEGAAMNA